MNEAEVGEEQYTFMILGYGVRDKEIDHLDFMIPSSDIKCYEETFNALEEYQQVIRMDTNNEQTERKIMFLKEEAKRLVKWFRKVKSSYEGYRVWFYER